MKYQKNTWKNGINKLTYFKKLKKNFFNYNFFLISFCEAKIESKTKISKSYREKNTTAFCKANTKPNEKYN